MDLVKTILRELSAEREALCLPSGHAMGWLGCGSREAHTPVDQSGSREQEVPNVGGTGRRGLRGVTEILAGRNHFTLDPTCRNSLGNKQGFSWILFFQGNK